MNSKRITHLTLLIAFLLSQFGCRTTFEDKEFTVERALAGNRIKLQNGKEVVLIGIANSKSAKSYLAENLVGRKVKLVFDSQNYPEYPDKMKALTAYVIDDENGSVNGAIIKKGLAEIDETNIHDSLDAFQAYLNKPQNENATNDKNSEEEPYSEESIEEDENENDNSNELLSLKELSKRTEPAVFIVLAENQYGEVVSQGTGFFVSNKGIGVSNFHVFEDGRKWQIQTLKGKTYTVKKILNHSKDYDNIVFSVEKSKNEIFDYLPISKETPSKGEDIFVIGNPRGLESTLTRGIVSALRGTDNPDDIIQIDAAISPGSSGSPVLNMKGKVVGIATAKIENCENCNFAINIKRIKIPKNIK